MIDLNDKTILITGGTGTLGRQLVRRIYRDYPRVKRLVVFSRDEQKQFDMMQEFPPEKFKSIR
ncbi:MAG: polysaccharide biosynthesis protein, partial [Chlorobi bacterium]|nr:polysaccharide biosynthesis protein [Chlorobiota bacterium]